MTVTAVKRSSMQGPASEGATMSAIDVTWVFGSSRATICAIVGSKIVSSSGTSSVTSRTISAQRRTSASARPTTATASALASLSAARTCSSSGSIRQLTLRAGRLEGASRLVGEIAVADHDDRPALAACPLHRARG